MAAGDTSVGSRPSTGESEQRVALMPAHETTHMGPKEVIGLVNGLRPFREQRLDRYEFPGLVKRGMIPAPVVYDLPDVDLSGTSGKSTTHPPVSDGGDRHKVGNHHATNGHTLWHRERKLPNGYVDPDKRY
jgi:type IV secretory pathway TraG/TraD family ATPase VirD4